jgi:hypothetical protein
VLKHKRSYKNNFTVCTLTEKSPLEGVLTPTAHRAQASGGHVSDLPVCLAQGQIEIEQTTGTWGLAGRNGWQGIPLRGRLGLAPSSLSAS